MKVNNNKVEQIAKFNLQTPTCNDVFEVKKALQFV